MPGKSVPYDWHNYVTIATLITEKDAQKLRIDSLARIIQYAMVIGGKEDYSFLEATQAIEEKLRFQFPDERLQKAWAELKNNNEIALSYSKPIEKFRLPSDKIKLIQDKIVKAKDLKNKVFENWFFETSKKYNVELDKNLFVSGMVKFLGKLATFSSKSAVWALELEKEAPLAMPDIFELVKDSIQSSDSKIIEIAKSEFLNFFTKPDKDRAEYVMQISEGIFELNLQNIKIRGDIVNPFENNIILYIDTNVIFSLFGFHDDHQNRAAEEFLNIAKKIKAKMRISTVTKREILRQVENAKDLYRTMNAPQYFKRQTFDRLLTFATQADNPIIKGFFRKAVKGEEHNWNDYINKLLHITHLLNQHSIETSDEGHDLLENKAINKLKQIVAEKGTWKANEATQEHDAFHYLLINFLRGKFGSPMNIWFISQDTSLYEFDYEARKDESYEMPCFSMSPSSFMLWIDNVSSARISGKDKDYFIGDFICSVFPYHRAEYDSKTLLRLATVFDRMENLPEDLMMDISMRTFQEYRHSEEKSLEENVLALDKCLAEIVHGEIDEEIRNKTLSEAEGKEIIKNLEERIAEAEKSAASLKEESKRKLTIKDKIIRFLVSIIILLVLIIVSLILKNLNIIAPAIFIIILSAVLWKLRKFWWVFALFLLVIVYSSSNYLIDINYSQYSWVFLIINRALSPLGIILAFIFNNKMIKEFFLG